MDVSDANISVTSAAVNDSGSDSIPVIEFLSGRHRGTHEKISEKTVFLAINEFGGISIVPASEAIKGEEYPIRLHRSGDTYELEVEPLFQVWVNGILTADIRDEVLIEGYIGLQAMGTGEIRFRNVKIKTLKMD